MADTQLVLLVGGDRLAAATVRAVVAAARSVPVLAVGEEPDRAGRAALDAGAAASLLRAAQTAMQRAKRKGRGTVELADASRHRRAVRRLEYETALRRALERDELEIHYQPIMSLADERPVGVEALARWRRPGIGVVPPDEFIPIAEQTGVIVPIGQWVLDRALRQAQTWRTELVGGSDLWVAVNVSARQLVSDRLVDVVEAAIRNSGIPSTAVQLELTESVLMQDPDRIARTLRRLHLSGVDLAIDDFGTGYSSFSYIKRFPVGTLKIDRCFMEGLADDAENASIVRAVLGLGRTLGLRTIAEGVETSSQLLALEGLGCELGQGFYWHRPAPAAKLESWLRSVLGAEPEG